MTELFDTTGVRDHDAQWEAMAERVAAHAMAQGGRVRFASSPVLWAGATLAFAASLLFMVLWSAPATPRDDVPLRVAFAPEDDVGSALVSGDAPPLVGALMFQRAPEAAP